MDLFKVDNILFLIKKGRDSLKELKRARLDRPAFDVNRERLQDIAVDVRIRIIALKQLPYANPILDGFPTQVVPTKHSAIVAQKASQTDVLGALCQYTSGFPTLYI
ncbi:hypothetical protein EYZ11_006263 [Aspergillus tanneri]|uniref:Uncharacterized protein n=1 Tax=Aspergillus tanneri TaxID=1220188 RepID=A0A4V3UP98_9EURO|nr:uncharacterized protein ATNIH1004_003387 [Aspergillus tanneri]KAA8650699.1 hypothetical protein ATNIH1004_003387 [Aspergillus tanneri]THC94254.1 hypothetical protein EYZ11_006263 [Aspergillus tanneri]